MKKLSKVILLFLIAAFMISAAGCSSSAPDEGLYIIEAQAVSRYIGAPDTVIVDMQKAEDYAKAHARGAVNITLGEIVVNTPVPNMLAPKGHIEKLLGSKGIGNETMVIIYDNNKNMEAARLWWTLKIYGHENARVVSGGLNALQAAKAEMTSETTEIQAVEYTARDMDASMIATIDEVKAQASQPQKSVVLLDTRTQEEFDQGTIPGSVLLDFIQNNYKDGTYKKVQDIKIQYIENGITPDKNVIMYCKTSVRAAQTYLALYNAGYRNIKVYDGAWLEWSQNMGNVSAPPAAPSPSQPPVESNNKDNS